MAYIRVIDEDEAEGELFDVYDKVQKTRGRLSNVLRIESLNPRGLRRHLDLYMELLFGKSPLPRKDRELVAVAVSAANACDYCVTHHAEALEQHTKDAELVRRVAKDPDGAELESRDRALVDYALGLTREPGEDRETAVGALRSAGFSDEEILHATEITAYFNFVNRIVTGLGVELEADSERDYDYG